jgi:hypothetical protein
MATKLESENSKIDAEKAEMQPKGSWITFPFLSGIYSLSPSHFPYTNQMDTVKLPAGTHY